MAKVSSLENSHSNEKCLWYTTREDNGVTVEYYLNLTVKGVGGYKIKIAASHFAELAKLEAKSVQ